MLLNQKHCSKIWGEVKVKKIGSWGINLNVRPTFVFVAQIGEMTLGQSIVPHVFSAKNLTV